MTLRVYLVRHATHSVVDQVLCGRMAGVGLNARGMSEARRIAASLAELAVDLVESSPRLRARQTATPIAQRHRLPVTVAPEIDELDVGEWTGQIFATLAEDPRWQAWNSHRASTTPPGGESMQALADRMLAHLRTLPERAQRGAVLVTHAEPIRAVLLHCRNLGFDRFAEIDVPPASVTPIDVDHRRITLCEGVKAA